MFHPYVHTAFASKGFCAVMNCLSINGLSEMIGDHTCEW